MLATSSSLRVHGHAGRYGQGVGYPLIRPSRHVPGPYNNITSGTRHQRVLAAGMVLTNLPLPLHCLVN